MSVINVSRAEAIEHLVYERDNLLAAALRPECRHVDILLRDAQIMDMAIKALMEQEDETATIID